MKIKMLFASVALVWACLFAVGSETTAEAAEPTMIVELDGFGFKSDFLFLRFEAGFLRAFEESELPYRVVIQNFPVKDYEGHPAIDLVLNFWKKWKTGEREINFWATYVSEDGKKYPLEIFSAKDHTLDVTYDKLVRDMEKNAYDASVELLGQLKALLEKK